MGWRYSLYRHTDIGYIGAGLDLSRKRTVLSARPKVSARIMRNRVLIRSYEPKPSVECNEGQLRALIRIMSAFYYCATLARWNRHTETSWNFRNFTVKYCNFTWLNCCALKECVIILVAKTIARLTRCSFNSVEVSAAYVSFYYISARYFLQHESFSFVWQAVDFWWSLKGYNILPATLNSISDQEVVNRVMVRKIFLAAHESFSFVCRRLLVASERLQYSPATLNSISDQDAKWVVNRVMVPSQPNIVFRYTG